MDKNKKGQAAMEYLMTYGWAILVIVIVLGILVWFVPQLIRPPEGCIFRESGLSCQEIPAAIVADANNNIGVTFRLDNDVGQTIMVHHVLCSTAAPEDVNSDWAREFRDMNQPIGSGASDIFGDPEDDELIASRVPCYNTAGDQLVLTPDSEFRGYIVVWYQHAEHVPGAPLRKASAVLSGTVLAETQ